jgi:hypothetical protein
MSLTSSLMTRHDRAANSSAIATRAVAQRAGENSGFQIRSPLSDF